MEDLVKKISQYQLLNFLMSGAVLVVALAKTTRINLGTDDVVTTFFLYYFIGMVVSRVGSLAVEPTLKLLRVIRFEPYPDYVKASAKDPKLDTLSQENNTYRTLIATFVLYLVIYLLNRYVAHGLSGKSGEVYITAATLLIVLFSFAYHKQTRYMVARIKRVL